MIKSRTLAKITSFLLLVFFIGIKSINAQQLKDASILVIGDSQILFRGGDAYVDYFTHLADECRMIFPDPAESLDTHIKGPVGVAGVRGASIDAWLSRGGPDKERICTPEASWPMNARGFGVLHKPDKKFVQIGDDPTYPLCEPGKSPVEALFQTAGIKPQLLVFSLLGSQSEFWARDRALADRDAENFAAQIPLGTPCIYMGTAPNFKTRLNVIRQRGQAHFFESLHHHGTTCQLVEGLTDQSIAALQGNKAFYKTNSEGIVRDGFHPNDAGIRTFLGTTTRSMCLAVSNIANKGSVLTKKQP